MIGKSWMTVSKHNLLLVAGAVWAFAGSMLIAKGVAYIVEHSNWLYLQLGAATLFGVAFFLLLFTRISSKHISRISTMEVSRPTVFAFFSLRSYAMMGGMITLGVTLRNLSFVNKAGLFTFYISMGVPLLLSAFRFWRAWINRQKA